MLKSYRLNYLLNNLETIKLRQIITGSLKKNQKMMEDVKHYAICIMQEDHHSGVHGVVKFVQEENRNV